jgi:hypothetical protein
MKSIDAKIDRLHRRTRIMSLLTIVVAVAVIALRIQRYDFAACMIGVGWLSACLAWLTCEALQTEASK